MVKGIADAIFQEILSQIHILVDIDECHFRLNHPELCQVARGVGVFSAEGRAECVDGSEGGGSEFPFKLPRHCQCRWLAEEIA